MYSIGLSIDGFIAGPDEQIDFFGVSDENAAWMTAELADALPTHVRRQLGVDGEPPRRFDTVVMGRRTCEPALAEGITSPYAHLRQVVVSRTLTSPDPQVTVAREPVAAVQALKQERTGLDVYLAGGGQLAEELVGEIDRLVVKLYPVVAGTGRAAFGTRFAPTHFDLDEVRTFAGGKGPAAVLPPPLTAAGAGPRTVAPPCRAVLADRPSRVVPETYRGVVRPSGTGRSVASLMVVCMPPVSLPTGLVLAAAGGLACYCAFPSLGWWWAAPLGVAALVVAVAGRRLRAALLVGLVFGVAFEMPLLSWSGVYVGWLPWTALAVFEALFLAVAAAGLALVDRAPGGPVLRAVAAAGVWVGVEALQARQPFGGFGWSRAAFSQSDAPTLALASLGGAPLVSFAVALAGALLGGAVLGLLRRQPSTGRSARLPIAAGLGAAAVGVVACGLVVPLPVEAQAGTVSVAGVQGNVAEPGLEFNAERRAVLDNHARGTADLVERVRAGEAPQPDIVVWPENASDIDPFENPDAEAVISAAVDAAGAPTLVGTLVRGADGRIRNTTLLWEPGIGPVDRYEKRHPVPFAEYVPYRSFFRRITPLIDLAGNMAAGTEVGLLRVGGVPVGDLICFEVVDDALVADTVDAGARLIVVQTNNATFGDTDESVQQLAMARLRAVEHGRAVAHVSTVGVSAMIAPDGRVLSRSELLTADVLQADLPLRSDLTPASRWRAWPEALLAAMGLLGAVAGAAAGRRRRAVPSSPAPAPSGGPPTPTPTVGAAA